jgi:hypothetical protein
MSERLDPDISGAPELTLEQGREIDRLVDGQAIPYGEAWEKVTGEPRIIEADETQPTSSISASGSIKQPKTARYFQHTNEPLNRGRSAKFNRKADVPSVVERIAAARRAGYTEKQIEKMFSDAR